jgi:hypothetical protein
MDNNRLAVYRDEIFIFDLIGVKNVLKYKPEYLYSEVNEDEVEIIIFETSTEIDFIKIHTEKNQLGIHSEYAWAEYTYPGFESEMQSLIQLKINDIIVPCDLIQFKNKETGEEKNIYFEISDFFGK